MLGKQWLNRYASTDMRGTAIERSQNRQRKLDGITNWYFDHVMESLPLMLQIALLLLGCALSRYLWEISTTVAFVVLGVTSCGVIFYFSIVVAGATSEDCPYQTPGARIMRHVIPQILRTLCSAPSTISAFVSSKLSDSIQASLACGLLKSWHSSVGENWDPADDILGSLFACSVVALVITPFTIIFLPFMLIMDASLLGQVMFRSLIVSGKMVYRWLMGTSTQTHALDLRCISWILQTSLDKVVHLPTLKYLESLVVTPTNFNPTLVAYCFNTFVGCVDAGGSEVVVTQGLEQLATVSALCLFYTISCLSIVDPASSVLKEIHRRYTEIFPTNIDFHGHQFSHTMNAVHRVFIRSVDLRNLTWGDYKPPRDEYILVAQTLVQLARFGYQRTHQTKVPGLVLRFSLHSLSSDTPPPTPVVADCLSIIAIDLGCDVSNTGAVTLDERCVHPS